MIKDFDFNYWKENTLIIAKEIDEFLIQINDIEKRKDIAQPILSQLRNLVEHTMVLCFLENQSFCSNTEYEYIEKARKFCERKSNFNFLVSFHEELKTSVSHYGPAKEQSERLLLKYIDRLISIKLFYKEHWKTEIFNSLSKYPLDLDSTFEAYYINITKALNPIPNEKNYSDLYYVRKKKMIFCNDIKFFEYTLTSANDDKNRFDSFIVFSMVDVFENYAIKAKLVKRRVKLFDKFVNLHFLLDYEVSIRNCEFEKLYKILKYNGKFDKTLEYKRLMNLIKESHKPLDYFLSLDKNDFAKFIKQIASTKAITSFIKFLEFARKTINSNTLGSNSVRYLLHTVDNEKLKDQLPYKTESALTPSLNLTSKDKLFDLMPFAFSMKRHNPSFDTLMDCFEFSKHSNETIRKEIANECKKNSQLYLDFDEINTNEMVKSISLFNKFIEDNSLSKDLEILLHGKNATLKDFEDSTVDILKLLLFFNERIMFPGYKEYATSKIQEFQNELDDALKIDALQRMFSTGSMFVVYGPAGTGKTTFAKYVLKLLGENAQALCLANTNPALKNIRDRIDLKNVVYKTIYSCSRSSEIFNCDILIIDECSTVSNRDFLNVLNKVNFKLLLLLGDVCQIESIQFGNWFSILKNFIPKSNYVELTNEFRCKENSKLNILWKAVRENSKTIEELIEKYKISSQINESIFSKTCDDEIILCLNYDGLYGINNINNYLQECNPNKPFYWKQYTFKVDDPILFTENKRFGNVLHNNLKGIIKNIEYVNDEQELELEILVDKILNPLTDSTNGLKIIENIGRKTLVSFAIRKPTYEEYESDSKDIWQVPFQIAYAISIHKAQGLEYQSVKIIITNEVEELVTHNIFYTAITRAKENLTIYWTPEVEKKILSSFKVKNTSRDAAILSGNFPEFKLVKK